MNRIVMTLSCYVVINDVIKTILLTKTTAAQNEVALSYDRVRGLYYQAIAFAAIIRAY